MLFSALEQEIDHTENEKKLFFLAIAAIGDEDQLAVAVGQQLARMQQPVKVIHKEHEAVTGEFEFPAQIF